MASLIQKNFRARKSFAKLKQVIEIPNLIDIQKRSYDKFLQIDIPIEKREDIGLQGVFKSVFPIKDFSETSSLEFVSYNLEKPKYDVDECRARGMTFAAPIKVVIRLVVWDVNEETGVQSIRDVKEQEVYFGEIPLMTDSGTFIINGTERVIVSQLHRSPGVFFDHDKGKTHSSGKLLYSARVIPYRGSWLDFEFDHKDILYVRIDRRRKLHATVLLRALGYSTEELLNYFYDTETIHFEPRRSTAARSTTSCSSASARRATSSTRRPRKSSSRRTASSPRVRSASCRSRASTCCRSIIDELVGKVSAKDVIDDSTGEVLLQCNEELTEAKLDELRERGVEKVEVLFIDNLNVGPYLRNTLLTDKLQGPDEAVMEIYRRLRPGDQPALDSAQTLFHNLFFNAERYDLSRVGRLKLNYKFKIDEAIETQILTKRDILETVRYLIELRNGRGVIDDIDHLGNRRVRAVGELMENQYRIGLVRMERAIKERMSMSQEIETLMPHDLINAKPVSRGGQGVLRQLAAVAVHGPDQPAVGSHPQAPPVGARTRWSDPRARGLRSPRRAPDALRPHLPDRDAGRSEHRPHRVAVDVRPRQRVRLHRDAVPRGRGRQDRRGGPVLLGAPGGGPDHRAGERRREERQARRRLRRRAARARTSS